MRATLVTILTLLAACGPGGDNNDGSATTNLDIGADASDIWAEVALGAPDEPTRVHAEVGFGLSNAAPTDTATVALDSFELGAGDVVVAVPGASLAEQTIDATAIYHVIGIVGANVTNGELAALCDDAPGAFARVTAHIEGSPPVTRDLPMMLTCKEDSRRQDLLDLVGEPNPANRPCELVSDKFVKTLRYDAGRVHIVDESFDGDRTKRLVYEYENDRVVARHVVYADDATLALTSRYTYDASGLLVQVTELVPGEEPDVTDFESTATAVSGGGTSYDLDGMTVTSQEGAAEIRIVFDEAPELVGFVTLPRTESAARWGAQSFSRRSPTTSYESVFVKEGGLIVREEAAVGSSDASTIWNYTCN